MYHASSRTSRSFFPFTASIRDSSGSLVRQVHALILSRISLIILATSEEFAAEEKLNNAEVEKEEENEFLCEKKKKNYSFRKSAICMQHLLLLFLTFSQST
jgi:hypothetical protein